VKRRPHGSKSSHRSHATRHAPAGSIEGRIVASYGRRYQVEFADASRLDCVTRSKRGALACGDRVSVALTAAGEGVIESLAPRTTLLYRSDRVRQKLVAANVDQIVIVVAPLPVLHEELVNRCLAAAEHGGIAALIALNKSDLPQATPTKKPASTPTQAEEDDEEESTILGISNEIPQLSDDSENTGSEDEKNEDKKRGKIPLMAGVFVLAGVSFIAAACYPFLRQLKLKQ